MTPHTHERPHRFLYLLVANLLLLVLSPLFEASGHLSALGLFALVVPAVAVYAISDTRWHLLAAVILGIPTVLGGAQISFGLTILPTGVIGICAVLFFGLTTAVILVHVLEDRTVTTDTLYGAVTVYLLIGVTWTVAYILLEHFQPGSFFVDAVHNPDGRLTQTDFLFYSFVTLTTVGYGDIAPLSSAARTLSLLEAVCGVLYVAVLVARLVAAYQVPPPPQSPHGH